MRSFTTAGMPGRCKRCLIVEAHCICAHVPTVATKTKVIIVRHEREGWKSTGTARIASLAMPSLEILEYGEDARPALDLLPGRLTAGSVLVFPTDDAAPALPAVVDQVVLLDGTWRQTRKMLGRLPALNPLPKLALPPATRPVLRLRESHLEEGRSTLEAVAEVVRLLEGEQVASPLFALHDDYVERVFKARGVWEQKRTAFEGA